MIINPNNIEKWCFDYFEGNLTSLERWEFERFILEHPEYQAEFEAWKSASDSDDDAVPAYMGAEALLVGATFYGSLAFRLSVGLVLTLAIGVLGYFQWGSVEKEYVSQSGLLEMKWSPDDHKLAMITFNDYAYGDYEVKTNTSTSYVTNYVYETDNHYGDDPNSIEWSESNIDLGDYTLSINQNNESEENAYNELAYQELKNVSEDVLFSQGSKLKDNYEEDDKTLFEHLGIDHSRYSFLNFNNSKVKGIGGNYNSSKNKNKHGKNDNHATIAQNSPKKGKNGGHNKKSNFFQNLKHLELGLTNINDPIAIAPNANVIAVNPALAGQLGVTRLKLNVRNQWWNTSESFYRGSAYFDTYFEKIQAGVSLGSEYNVTDDGKQTINKYMFTYAQKFSLSRNTNISVGLSYEMNKGVNNGALNDKNEFYANSPITSNSLENQWKSDLGVSTWYSGKYFFGGFNVTNLLGNTFIATHEGNSTYFNNINFSVQMGTDYKKSMFANTVISPFVQYNKLGDHQDLWLGSVFRIKGLVLGGSVATSKSARAILGLQGNKFRITLSSDYGKSLLLNEYAFSHELSMRILLGNKNNNWSRYDY